MSAILMVAIAGAGFGFLLIMYNLLKKGATFAAKLPTNVLICMLVFGLIGLTGFMMDGQAAAHPVLKGILLIIVSITIGTYFTNKLYVKWDWSIGASFWKKFFYLLGITLTAIISFALIFLLCEHRGWPKKSIANDLVWPLSALILVVILPLLINHLHFLWNKIPKVSQIIPTIKLPLSGSPPFIETGGPSINFLFIIPLTYHSTENVKSTVALPFNKTLAEAFHYKLHEHNIVQRFAKKIIFAENNKRSKIYSWRFYRKEPKWWGWWNKRYYLNPEAKLGATINKGETIFVERVRTWE